MSKFFNRVQVTTKPFSQFQSQKSNSRSPKGLHYSTYTVLKVDINPFLTEVLDYVQVVPPRGQVERRTAILQVETIFLNKNIIEGAFAIL